MRIAGAVLTAGALLLGVAGCGGSDDAAQSTSADGSPVPKPGKTAKPAELERVNAALAAYAIPKDANAACEEALARDFVLRNFGSTAQCVKVQQELIDSGDAPTGVRATNLVVTGDTGVVTVVISGGIADGATGPWEIERVEGSWRLRAYTAEYHRSELLAGLRSYRPAGPEDPFSDAGFVKCYTAEVTKMSEAKIEALAQAAFRDDTGPAERLAEKCMLRGVDGEPSFVRKLFERGAREADIGLTKSQMTCALKRLRTTVTDKQLLDSIDDKKVDSLITDKLTEAMLQCGVGKANSRTGAKAIETKLPKMPKVSKAFFNR